jgi:hypothetical protein
MFGELEQLKELVERLEVGVDGRDIAEGYRLLDRFTAKLSEAVGVFDAEARWDDDGHPP